MKAIGEIIREQNIVLTTLDSVTRGGFTQVPNFILRDPDLSLGAKVTYAMFLSYAWHNDSCFPGQDRLAIDLGMSRTSVTAFIGELQKRGLIAVQRRGQGRTNVYTVHFKVTKSLAKARESAIRPPEVSRLTSRG